MLLLRQPPQVPQLEMRGHPEQHHVAFQSGSGAQLGGHQNAAGAVDLGVGRAAKQQPLQRPCRVGQRGDVLAPGLPYGARID